MNTEDFINALVEDHGRAVKRVGDRMFGSLAICMVVSIVMLISALGSRPNFIEALLPGWRRPFKFGFALILAANGLSGVLTRSGPERKTFSTLRTLAVPPLLPAAGIAVELASAPATSRLNGMRGSNSGMCLLVIPLLATAPLAGSLLFIRDAASRLPAMSSVLAGLLAGTIVSIVGGFVGARSLRW